MDRIDLLAMDIAATFLAFANALENKGLLTKTEIAAAAQERLVVLRTQEPPDIAAAMQVLQTIAVSLAMTAPEGPSRA